MVEERTVFLELAFYQMCVSSKLVFASLQGGGYCQYDIPLPQICHTTKYDIPLPHHKNLYHSAIDQSLQYTNLSKLSFPQFALET